MSISQKTDKCKKLNIPKQYLSFDQSRLNEIKRQVTTLAASHSFMADWSSDSRWVWAGQRREMGQNEWQNVYMADESIGVTRNRYANNRFNDLTTVLYRIDGQTRTHHKRRAGPVEYLYTHAAIILPFKNKKLICLDLDNCVIDPTGPVFREWAGSIIAEFLALGAFVEWSSSGRGIHVITPASDEILGVMGYGNESLVFAPGNCHTKQQAIDIRCQGLIKNTFQLIESKPTKPDLAAIDHAMLAIAKRVANARAVPTHGPGSMTDSGCNPARGWAKHHLVGVMNDLVLWAELVGFIHSGLKLDWGHERFHIGGFGGLVVNVSSSGRVLMCQHGGGIKSGDVFDFVRVISGESEFRDCVGLIEDFLTKKGLLTPINFSFKDK